MSNIGKPERATQNRVIDLFRDELHYQYLGDKSEQANSNIEDGLIVKFLKSAGYSDAQISRAIYLLKTEANNPNRSLYDNNKAVYSMLRYGVDVKVEAGALSDNSYAELAKLGLDKNLVDGYIEGQKAISDNYQKQIYNEVGSQEQYMQLVDWASKNLSDEEVESFNDVISNGSIQAMKFAVRGLMATAGMKQSSVKQQDLFQGDSDVISVDAFQSIAQVTQAMNDPRYEKDPAYRKEVTDKIARSSVL